MAKKHTEEGALATELILEVFRLNGCLLSAGDKLVAPFGQTSSRWQVLGALDEKAQTVSEIARKMGLTRQSVQRTVNLLRSERILEIIDNPLDKRAGLVRLTKKGRATLDEMHEAQVSWINALSKGFGAPQIKAAYKLLSEFRQKLSTSSL